MSGDHHHSGSRALLSPRRCWRQRVEGGGAEGLDQSRVMLQLPMGKLVAPAVVQGDVQVLVDSA
jgi:hypothetical protein